jgi:hypothetical protein
MTGGRLRRPNACVDSATPKPYDWVSLPGVTHLTRGVRLEAAS